MMPERDLQVTVHSKYYGLVAKVVKCILICVSKSVASRSKELIIPHYSVAVRLHLEYCVQFSFPGRRKTLTYWSEYIREPPK